MVALDSTSQLDVPCAVFPPCTAHGAEAEKFVADYCRQNNISYIAERVRETIPAK